jgi:predicted DNA-binding protein YlxM (UPF0122 family)
MAKDLLIIELFDIYGGLLTERQRELFTSYYLFDLSLAEIAEPEGKTRQNVYEQVKKVKAKLIEYENLLHIREKNLQITDVAEELSASGNNLGKRLLDIVNK